MNLCSLWADSAHLLAFEQFGAGVQRAEMRQLEPELLPNLDDGAQQGAQ